MEASSRRAEVAGKGVGTPTVNTGPGAIEESASGGRHQAPSGSGRKGVNDGSLRGEGYDDGGPRGDDDAGGPSSSRQGGEIIAEVAPPLGGLRRLLSPGVADPGRSEVREVVVGVGRRISRCFTQISAGAP